MVIYRVTVRTTNSRQPGGSFWHYEVKYCGYDRNEARQAYHRQSVSDYSQGYGNKARETRVELIKDTSICNEWSDDEIQVLQGM
jgi:hypothetical protein